MLKATVDDVEAASADYVGIFEPRCREVCSDPGLAVDIASDRGDSIALRGRRFNIDRQLLRFRTSYRWVQAFGSFDDYVPRISLFLDVGVALSSWSLYPWWSSSHRETLDRFRNSRH